jgi:enoyl-CoA hydratase/carnithine racemase
MTQRRPGSVNAAEYGALRAEVTADGVAILTLDRPDHLNAFTAAMGAELSDALARCDADPAVRVVVLTGAGRAFCAGADLSPGSGPFGAPADPAAFTSSPVRPAPFEMATPVIAAVNGHAIGIGMTLALQCDLRVMAADAKWGVVQSRRGVVGDCHAHFTLVRSVGVAKAAEILLTGATFTGVEALRLGVASLVVPAAEVLTTALALASEMATHVAPLSAALSKRILWAAADGATAASIDELERAAHLALMGRPDAREGAAAFMERRDPVWTAAVPTDLPDDPRFGLPAVRTPR